MIRKLAVLSILSLLTNFLYSQCREYIKAVASSQLEPYVIDGNFFAPIVYEGDEVTLNRTFLAGQHYKIIVLGMDIWQKYIQIKDKESGIILFQNYSKKNKPLDCNFTDYQGNLIPCIGSNYFEFTPERSMNLEITVKIEQKAKRKKDRLQGCLGIVVGFLPNDYQQEDTTQTQ